MVYHVNADGLVGARVRVSEANSSEKSHNKAKVRLSKRVFDLVFAVILVVFFSPFILGVAAIIWFADRSSVLFAHERIGLNGKTFKCLKFRTMCLDADVKLERLLQSDPAAREEWEQSQKLANDPRLTSVGLILRKTSLDELPQLWNVLRGEMSMVGPRPIVADEAKHYGSVFADYKSVLPGLTGAWQVSGRSNTTYEERVALDADYIKKASLVLDTKIVLKTVWVVIAGKGAM